MKMTKEDSTIDKLMTIAVNNGKQVLPYALEYLYLTTVLDFDKNYILERMQNHYEHTNQNPKEHQAKVFQIDRGYRRSLPSREPYNPTRS